jgi:hypothetical protein
MPASRTGTSPTLQASATSTAIADNPRSPMRDSPLLTWVNAEAELGPAVDLDEQLGQVDPGQHGSHDRLEGGQAGRDGERLIR